MDISKLWSSVLAEIEIQVSKATFVTIFKATFLFSLENNIATVACPNPMILKMAETRYYSLIKNSLDKHTGTNLSLIFIVKASAGKKTEAGPLFEQEKPATTLAAPSLFNPFYTFENFAVSSSNQVAYAASQAVVKSPGTAYSPLFIYGGVGVGKTHLTQAIGHALFEKNSRLKIIYTTGEEFTNEIVDAIRQKNTKFFKNHYRGVGLLLVDDIQFIAGKEKVQEEFFHTFNALQKENSQVILTSDKQPSEIAGLEDRLKSRFDGGLTIDIGQPDSELRAAILLIKAKSMGIILEMDLAQFIAANISDNRRMEGFLRRLNAEAQTQKVPLSLDLAGSILKKNNGQLKEKEKKRVSPEKILEAVAQRFNLSPSQLRGQKRDRSIAQPRQMAMLLLRVDCEYPLMAVGEALGGRDHTTVMHGVEKISGLLLTSEKLKEDLLWIKKEIWGAN